MPMESAASPANSIREKMCGSEAIGLSGQKAYQKAVSMASTKDKKHKIWIRADAYQVLKKQSVDRGIKVLDILDYLMLTMKRYDLLSEGWEARLTSATMKEYKEKVDAQLAAALEKDKVGYKYRLKRDLLNHYIKAMPPEERKTFIENLLPDMDKPDFLDIIGEMDLILLDGKRQAIRLGEDRKPIFPKGAEIIACSRGYHTVNGFCECDIWRECEIRNKEYTDFRFKISPEGKQYRLLKDREDKARRA